MGCMLFQKKLITLFRLFDIDAACMLPQELREPTYTWANPNDWALGINNAAKDNEDTTEKHALKFLGCLLLSA